MSIRLKKIKNKYLRRILFSISFIGVVPYIVLLLLVLTAASPFIGTHYEEIVASWEGVFREDIPFWIRENW